MCRKAAASRLALAFTLLGLPTSVAGQGVHNVHIESQPALTPVVRSPQKAAFGAGRFRFEPWGGALWDAYRNDGGNGRPAWIGAARFGYELGPGPLAGRSWRLIGEVGRAEAAEAGTAVVADSFEVGFRTEWWLLTAGVEWDVIAGWSGVSVEGRAGAAWIEREIVAGELPPPGTPGTSDTADPEPFPALVLGISAYRHLTHSLQVRLRVEDVITDPFAAGTEQSPVIGLGLRFVFE